MCGYKYVEWKKEVEDTFINIVGANIQEAITGSVLYNYYKIGYEPADVVKEISEKIRHYGFL